jgi:hypothetical protein
MWRLRVLESDHLELVTHAENQWYLRKTHCKHGHPLSGDNLRISPNGVRACRRAMRPTSGRFGSAMTAEASNAYSP